MDTSKMKLFEALTLEKNFTALSEVKEIREMANNIFDILETNLIRSQIVDVLADYDLGTVVDVYEIFGGYVNRSFGVYVEKDGQRNEYFIRKYKKAITEKEIRFEHSLINFAIANGLEIAAKVIPARNGETFVKKPEGDSYNFFAVYEYLKGEDKYTWDAPYLNDEEFRSMGETLAMVHNSTRNFDPQGLQRVEPPILEFLPTLEAVYREYAKRDIKTKYHDYFLENLEEIFRVINLNVIPPEAEAKMPKNPCHCDYHPGNVKFLDNKAVGIFDFDWSKIDLRLFDVCFGLVYTCSDWSDMDDGTLRLDKCAIFLKGYQDKLRELGGLEPLNEVEIEYFPIMTAAANVYLINWCVADYYNKPDLNVYEYLAYLQHNVRLMKWIEQHKADILAMVKEATA